MLSGDADRQPIGVARALEQHRQLLLQRPRVGAEAEPPLLEDDAALLVDLVGFEGDVGGPVAEDEEGAIDDRAVVGRNLQQVDRLVEAGVRVDVGAEPHPRRLQERDDLLLREVARAVERHVLDEVREAALVVVLEHRAGVDGEAELGAPGRLGVVADVVAQAVRQRADRDPRIDRHRDGQRRRLGRRRHRRRRLARGRSPRRRGRRRLCRKDGRNGRRQRGREPQEPNRSQKLHGFDDSRHRRDCHPAVPTP